MTVLKIANTPPIHKEEGYVALCRPALTANIIVIACSLTRQIKLIFTITTVLKTILKIRITIQLQLQL